MKIFIISIEEEKSPRLQVFLQQPFFQHNKLEYTKIGIKGGELSAKQYFELAVKGRSNSLTPGELGCTLSHLEALRVFLESSDEYALVLEDDAILNKNFNFNKLVNELKQKQLPNNLLFSLGGIQMKECRKIRGKYCRFNFLDKNVLEVVPDFLHRVNYTFAYIVDRAMAKTLLAYHQPIRRADDWSCLYDFDSTSKIYMTYLVDHPVIEKGEMNKQLSLIENERVTEHKKLKSKYGTTIRKNIAKFFNQKYSLK